MTGVIELRGLRLLATFGALPEERERAQPLEVDLDLHLDVAAAAGSDDVADTVHYGEVCATVERVVGDGHTALLERLAARIADALLALDGRVDEVTVVVRKLRPPVPHHLDHVGVRLTRLRAGGG